MVVVGGSNPTLAHSFFLQSLQFVDICRSYMFNFYKCLQYVELPTAWIFIILELLVYMMHATSDGANYFPGTTQARLFAGHANLVKKCVCVFFWFFFWRGALSQHKIGSIEGY